LQHWDAVKEKWRPGPSLLSDTATHTHWLPQPTEAAKFRLVSTGGGSWPAGNLRLGEIVFHGEVLSASHPDVVARKAVAVLFDENEPDLQSLKYPGRPFAFLYEGAYSGGKCVALTAEGSTAPGWSPPFGHVVPNWDFEIVEHPGPGQYRWLQFAWKALSPKTTGIYLRASEGHHGGFAITAGTLPAPEGAKPIVRADRPPSEWQVVRVDLWSLYGRPVRIRSLALGTQGGGAAFDQILLGRREKDLPGGAGVPPR
jgi:hypothetical protein